MKKTSALEIAKARTKSTWWIPGSIYVDQPPFEVYHPARKHRLFRFVQARLWGNWLHIRPEYKKEIKDTFSKS